VYTSAPRSAGPGPESPSGPGPHASVIALFPVSSCRSGNVLLEELAARGVCVDHVVRCPGRMRRNLVLEFRDRELVVEDSASRAAAETDYDLRPIADLEHLLVSGALHRAVLRSAAAADARFFALVNRALWTTEQGLADALHWASANLV